MHERMLTWPRRRKQFAVILLDVALALVSTWLAFSLRRSKPWHVQRWPCSALVHGVRRWPCTWRAPDIPPCSGVATPRRWQRWRPRAATLVICR